uniref:Uncharacterized protein n=1 Tax=Siphoviridae sp. ctwzt2 TaxID=2825736 RepID=A0A8S5P7Z7_9CAUD|nr:MAG TPA: hypothetical protein [Siphoviridae sp. ctwzt2]DAV38301.1 MAG TPA: hypothetical protein [Caudoviricetes sp.]
MFIKILSLTLHTVCSLCYKFIICSKTYRIIFFSML